MKERRYSIIERIARKIIIRNKVIADPDLYFECKKREPNNQIFLDDKHLEHCKLLSTREKLLEEMPKGAVCAEVGVAEGYYSDKILNIVQPRLLYLIEYDSQCCINLERRFKTQIEAGIVKILQGDSVEMIKQLEDDTLDFVFLDATHDYEHPKAELNAVQKKVKADGYIMGHDYTRFSMWEALQYGVIEAVNEFAVKENYELVYFTMDILHSNPSYALRKMKTYT